MPTGLLYSRCTFLSSWSEMLVMGVLILPLGEHQKILTISFTRVFSLALNAVQFTFEIRCRGEQNVTRHVAVVPFFLFQCSLFTATEPQKKSVQVKNEVFLDFSLPLLLGDEISLIRTLKAYVWNRPLSQKKKVHFKKITIMHLK